MWAPKITAFFFFPQQLLKSPGAEDGRRVRAQNFQPTYSGTLIPVWEQPEGGIWENHSPCLYRSIHTQKAASGASPGHRPPPQITANGASAAPGEKPIAGQRRESMNADMLVSSTTVFRISEHPGKPALEIPQRLFRVLTWGN